MKALLDTSFLRHLSLVNELNLIPELRNNLGWEFILPQMVIDELNERSIDRSLRRTFMQDGTVQIDCCNETEFLVIKQIMMGLGDGELEAICIVNKCDDRKFKEYLILTDDAPAQKKASKLGMSSLDVVTFLFYSNQKGLLNRDLALNSLEILQQSGYFIDDNVIMDFQKRLI